MCKLSVFHSRNSATNVERLTEFNKTIDRSNVETKDIQIERKEHWSKVGAVILWVFTHGGSMDKIDSASEN